MPRVKEEEPWLGIMIPVGSEFPIKGSAGLFFFILF